MKKLLIILLVLVSISTVGFAQGRHRDYGNQRHRYERQREEVYGVYRINRFTNTTNFVRSYRCSRPEIQRIVNGLNRNSRIYEYFFRSGGRQDRWKY